LLIRPGYGLRKRSGSCRTAPEAILLPAPILNETYPIEN
jgi:hypothetical protein